MQGAQWLAFLAGLHAYLSPYTNQSINKISKVTPQLMYSKYFLRYFQKNIIFFSLILGDS